MRVIRLFISAAQADEAHLDFEPLRFRKREPAFLGKILGNGIGPDVDAARVDAAFLEEEQVAGLGANIQEHGAALQVAIIIAKGVTEGGRSDVDQLQAQAGGFGDPEQALDNVGLDRHQQHFQFAAGRRP